MACGTGAVATISKRGVAEFPVPNDLCRLMLKWRRLLTIVSVRPGVRKAPENVVRAVIMTYGPLEVVRVRMCWWVVSPTLLASSSMGTLGRSPDRLLSSPLIRLLLDRLLPRGLGVPFDAIRLSLLIIVRRADPARDLFDPAPLLVLLLALYT